MIKYLGSKRRLVPALSEMCQRSGASTALDLFTGTTRVARAFKQCGAHVTAVDTSRYSEVFAQTYIEADADAVDQVALQSVLDRLNELPGESGYFTQTFCVESRFFQPHNGARVDAIRNAIAGEFHGSPLEPMLLTTLLLAADRVDSTTGLQMAYVKQWAKRASNDLELRLPDLLPGTGRAVRGDAVTAAPTLGSFDLAYLDPPYNQHRYFTNYHIWETLVAWDQPEYYGVACKRIDSRDEDTKSAFNRKREMPSALTAAISGVDAEVVVVSYNDESWVTLTELRDMCAVHGDVVALAFDSKRYVGAQIGIHNPSGERVGKVSHTRNFEYVLVAGPTKTVAHITAPFLSARV